MRIKTFGEVKQRRLPIREIFMNPTIDKLVKNYDFLKEKLELIEQGKWQEDKMLQDTSVDDIETLKSLVQELEDMGIGIISKLKQKVN